MGYDVTYITINYKATSVSATRFAYISMYICWKTHDVVFFFSFVHMQEKNELNSADSLFIHGHVQHEVYISLENRNHT